MLDKIKSREEIALIIKSLKDNGKRVGYTSGTFDLIHPGHIQYLAEAKNEVDCLVVGVNDDSSVKEYKDPLRPIVLCEARLKVVAGLGSVDYVFSFSEKNNNHNIELLKPSVYLKAGDYTPEKLSSKSIVESYGGEIKIIPFIKGYSSTVIIEKIQNQFLINYLHAKPEKKIYEPKAAIFVDRDGTIIEHVPYLHEPEKVKLIPGALEALKDAQDKGYRIIMVTNQPGIGMGYFTVEDFHNVNLEIFKKASKVGVLFDKIYFSPFSKADKTNCRKPNTGMVDRAKAELNIIIEDSFCIGDMTGDVQLAKNAGCKAVLVKTGIAGSDHIFEAEPDYTLESLADLVSILPK